MINYIVLVNIYLYFNFRINFTANMSGPQHHFLPGLPTPQQGGMRNQFGTGPMPSQIGSGIPNQMAGQLGNQMPVQIPNQMGQQMSSPMISPMGSSLTNQMGAQIGNQMNATMNNQINPALTAGNQLLGPLNQQFNINTASQMQQHQTSNPLQLPQTSMGK